MTPEMTADEQQVAAVLDDLYDAYRANDQDRFDSHLAPGITAWETYFDGLYTKAEVDAFRDRRAAAGARPVRASLEADIQALDVWDDTALVRYHLVARATLDSEPEIKRVTEVLRRTDGRWLIVHRHAESGLQ